MVGEWPRGRGGGEGVGVGERWFEAVLLRLFLVWWFCVGAVWGRGVERGCGVWVAAGCGEAERAFCMSAHRGWMVGG